MKKLLLSIALLPIVHVTMHAQETGSWRSHLAYHNTTAVAETNELVYALADNSLYSYDKADNSLLFYSTLTGLSDTYLNQIGYNQQMNCLVLTYENGNIDLMQPGKSSVKNLPFVKDDIMIQDKTVRNIYMYKEFAYLSTPFGIVVVNIKKEEIADTYRLQTGVYATCINGNTIYAATDNGILHASLTSNLSDYHNWNTYPLIFPLEENEKIQKIDFFLDSLVFFVKGNANNGVYYQVTDGAIQPIKKDMTLTGFTIQNGQLIAYGTSYALIMSSFTDPVRLNNSPVNDVSSYKEANTFWIAAGNDGLKGVKKNGNSFELIVSGLETDSPIRNLDAFMTFHNQKLLVAGGDREADRSHKPFTFMIYDDSKWYNSDEAAIRTVINTTYNLDYVQDATSVAADPRDDNHYYVSTWGEGVLEFKDNLFVALYNHTNSALQTAVESNARHYVRVEGLCFDQDNNLWMTNSGTDKGLKVFKADGTWKTMNISSLSNQSLIDKILITKDNHKWINVLRSTSKIVVFDDNGTIDDESDDRTRTISNTALVTSTGSVVNASTYNCMAEDVKNGTVWIGSKIGPLICTNPKKALDNPDNPVVVYRPVRTGDDGLTGYLLDSENIKAIAIDGGNRKWIGTETAGVFILSEDGSETIEQFTTDNSPLPSNTINSLAINPVTGEVCIGTNKGIVSYMSGVTEGSEAYTDVYAYPNPVRPEYNDQVTITGLMTDSNVKITDLNGNLIYQARSVGGQLVWNCRTGKGERVATGIYLVLASQPDKGESVVTKIMVIK